VTEYQITRWRDIPSLIVARSGEIVVKVSLPAMFQEAIDEAAMRLGEDDADAYLAGWVRSAWLVAEGTPDEVANSVSSSILNEFSEAHIAAILGSLSQGTEE
jgi:hypothetical protein